MGTSFWIFYVAFCGIMSIHLPFFAGSVIGISGLNLRLSDVLLILLCDIAFINFTIRKRGLFRHAALTNSLVLFLLWMMFSAFVIAPLYNTPIIDGSLFQFKRFMYFGLFFLTLLFLRLKHLKDFTLLCIIYGFIVSVLISFGSIYYFNELYNKSSDLANQFLHSRLIAQLTFFLCLGLITYLPSSKKRMLLTGACITALFAILAGLSRGAMLTTILGILLYFKLLQKKLKTFFIIAGLLFVTTASLLILQTVKDVVFERIEKGVNNFKVVALILQGESPIYIMSTAYSYNSDLSLTRKLIEHRAVMDEFKKSPIWGLGIGHRYEKYWMKGGDVYKQGAHVHSVYNYFLMNTGIIGLALFLRVLFKMGKQFYHVFRTATDPTFKGVFLGCLLNLVALSINSFNGSFLLDIPIIAFICIFSAMGEIVVQASLAQNVNNSMLWAVPEKVNYRPVHTRI